MKELLIPERLKMSREALSITRMEAARRMNIGQATYVRYENGTRNPTYATIILMSQVLNVSPEYLVGKSDKPQQVSVTINQTEEPDIYEILKISKNMNLRNKELLLTYARELSRIGKEQK